MATATRTATHYGWWKNVSAITGVGRLSTTNGCALFMGTQASAKQETFSGLGVV